MRADLSGVPVDLSGVRADLSARQFEDQRVGVLRALRSELKRRERVSPAGEGVAVLERRAAIRSYRTVLAAAACATRD